MIRFQTQVRLDGSFGGIIVLRPCKHQDLVLGPAEFAAWIAMHPCRSCMAIEP